MPEVNDEGWFPDTLGERKDELDAGMLEQFPAKGNEFLDLTPDSYTGRTDTVMAEQLIVSEDLVADFLDLMDPGQSQGVYTDYHLRLQGTQRKKATQSTILARLEGLPGKLVGDKRVRYIPNDTIWRTPILGLDGEPLVISANGITDGIRLTADESGPIDAVETGTTSWVIVDQVTGWATAESTARAVLGTLVESDSVARTRLKRPSTSALGLATEPACVKALFEIDGVTDADINTNRQIVPVEGVPAKSIEGIVEGGDSQTIANVILATYPGAAGFFGNTEVTATASFVNPSGQTITLTRQVKYTIPELVPIIAEYTITYGRPDNAPDDGGREIALTTASDYINGAGRGVDVVPTTSAAAITCALPTASEPVVVGLVAIKNTGPVAAANIPISVRQRATTNTLAQPAITTGTEVETFAFIVTWILDMSINNGAPLSVTFAITDFVDAGAARASEVAAVIGKAVVDVVAGVDEGAVQMTTAITGAAASIRILNSSSPDLLTELGFTIVTDFGSDGDIVLVIS